MRLHEPPENRFRVRVVVPVANDVTVQQLCGSPGLLAPGDWVTVNSGGVDRAADPLRVQTRAETVARAFPYIRVYAFTSGLANVQLLSQSLHSPLQGIFYDYEPNYPNEPEFSFDPSTTSRNLATATEASHREGLSLIGYLTGRALLNPQHQWNYAQFLDSTDAIVIQTQASLRMGRWKEALDKIERDFGSGKPAVQITVAPGLPNAVDVGTAQSAWEDLVLRRFPAVVIWWIPTGFKELQSLLQFADHA